MSVTLKNGDLLKDKSEAITNTVNCVGVMGKGIALQFKQRCHTTLRLMPMRVRTRK
jgi:O-acetyl-ADP-ribose deacetylase (regulator of RNase III)